VTSEEGKATMRGAVQFWNDETGAVAVDWVVLSAGVVTLAIVVTPPIQVALVGMAMYIRDTILQYQTYLQ
jgi:Flp pilus assembly pilin Flp